MGSIPEPAKTDTMVPPRDLTSEMDFATRYRLRCNTAIVMDFLDLAILAYCTHARLLNPVIFVNKWHVFQHLALDSCFKFCCYFHIALLM